MAWLTNKWMNSPAYLAASAHVYGAASLVLAAFVLGGWRAAIWAVSIGIPAAAIKEFWYDARYELPKQTTRDNVTDFVTYLTGAAIALGVLVLSAL